MITFENKIKFPKSNLIVGFDLEWTKNYKIKNGNAPFCFSFVYFTPDFDFEYDANDLSFGFFIQYIENKNEAIKLIACADNKLKEFLKYGRTATIVGHQLSSDISVLLNFNGGENWCKNFKKLRDIWKARKYPGSSDVHVFDTRYDMNEYFRQESRRLVDVCTESKLNVKQPELKYSMTKMQNMFYDSADSLIMEKISVLNIRHSLSAALLYCLFYNKIRLRKRINVNSIICKNLFKYFSYIKSREFQALTPHTQILT